MKLNVVNPDAKKINDALGISEERSEELCKAMDRIVRDLLDDETKEPSMATIQERVVAQCNNIEEAVLCIYLNARMMSALFNI